MTNSTAPSGDDDVLAGGFDQTNGVVEGLDGESDGTVAGENEPGATRDGSLGTDAVADQDDVDAETLQEGEGDTSEVTAADTSEGRVP